MASDKVVTRRQYSAAFKAQVVAECEAAGASVARVALLHGVNANVVHRWRQLARDSCAVGPSKTSMFLPVPLGLNQPQHRLPAASSGIRVELSKGPLVMVVSWPASAASDFAAWTRELLR